MEPAPEQVPHPGDQLPRRPSVERFHEMPEADANHHRTILEYLNEDCWRAILDYLPLIDIIKCERVNRQWRQVVLTYLSYAQIRVRKPLWSGDQKLRDIWACRLHSSSYGSPSFESWTKKLGSSVVNYHYYYVYDSEEPTESPESSLNIVGENCPNLVKLKLWKSRKLPEPLNKNEYFRNLQALCFSHGEVTDACVSQFLASNDLEILRIIINEFVTGEFLTNLKSTKLKELVFKRCYNLSMEPLLSVATRLGGLTKLVLKLVPLARTAHLLLDKMPGLEYLLVTFSMYQDDQGEPYTTHSDEFFELVSRLRNLEYLRASHRASDRHIESVMRGTKVGRLDVAGDWCTERGIAALCSAGERLTEVYLPCRLHPHVMALVRACRNLKFLSTCPALDMTRKLGRRIIKARRALSPTPPQLFIDLYKHSDWCYFDDLKGNEHLLYMGMVNGEVDSDYSYEH